MVFHWRQAWQSSRGFSMRVIPPRIHGVLDYLVGVALVASPWIFDFAGDGGARLWVPIVLGASTILYSILTDYEPGLLRIIPMPAHLALDFGAGVVLAASPWLFGFDDVVKWPHLIAGLFEIVVVALSQVRPEDEIEYETVRTPDMSGARPTR
jgi:hypothetical protein